MNGDGNITVNDVALLVSKVLGREVVPVAPESEPEAPDPTDDFPQGEGPMPEEGSEFGDNIF